MSFFCLLLQISISFKFLLFFLVLSFIIIPSQEHGASSNILSKVIDRFSIFSPEILKIIVFLTLHLDKLKINEGILLGFGSQATIVPLFFIF